jgi:hypothetical protein
MELIGLIRKAIGRKGGIDERMTLWIILLIVFVLVIALFFALSSGLIQNVFLKELI